MPVALTFFRNRWSSLVPAGLLAFSAAMAVLSTGFLELDELTHFMKAREVWTEWRGLLDIWGRPLCTGLYSLAAPFGIPGARLLAVLVAGLTAAGTVALGRELRRLRPNGSRGWNSGPAGLREHNDPDGETADRREAAWLWLLLFAQPLFLLESFAVMTEMLLALVWVWAAVAIMRRRNVSAGILIGLGGLARPEGLMMAAFWPVLMGFGWLLCRRSQIADRKSEGLEENAPGRTGFQFAICDLRPALFSALFAVLPTVLWWAMGWAAYGEADWFLQAWPWPLRSRYGPGLQILLGVLLAWVWLIIPMTAAFRRIIKQILRGRSVLPGSGVQEAAAWSGVAALVAAYALFHVVLGCLGLFGSLGLPRYFVAIAPFVALLAWQGLDTTLQRTGRRRLRAAAIVALALAPAAILVGAGQLPVPRNLQFERLDAAIDWVNSAHSGLPSGKDNGAVPGQPRIVAAHPYVFFRLGLPLSSEGHRMAFDAKLLRSATADTWLVTENVIWEYDGFAAAKDLKAWGYERVWESDGAGDRFSRRFPILKRLVREHLLAMVADAARVQVWVKR